MKIGVVTLAAAGGATLCVVTVGAGCVAEVGMGVTVGGLFEVGGAAVAGAGMSDLSYSVKPGRHTTAGYVEQGVIGAATAATTRGLRVFALGNTIGSGDWGVVQKAVMWPSYYLRAARELGYWLK